MAGVGCVSRWGEGFLSSESIGIIVLESITIVLSRR